MDSKIQALTDCRADAPRARQRADCPSTAPLRAFSGVPTLWEGLSSEVRASTRSWRAESRREKMAPTCQAATSRKEQDTELERCNRVTNNRTPSSIYTYIMHAERATSALPSLYQHVFNQNHCLTATTLPQPVASGNGINEKQRKTSKNYAGESPEGHSNPNHTPLCNGGDRD